jgi:hypothetical protein
MSANKLARPLIALALCLFIGSLAIYLFIAWANQPVEQTIGSPPSTNVTPDITLKMIRTTQYTTKINEDFREQTTENPSRPGLIQTLLFDTKETGAQVGITVSHLPTDGLQGVADYNLRVTTPDTYKPFTDVWLPADSHAFQKVSGNELSLFLSHTDRYASITVSNHDISTMTILLKTVVDNWQWL